MLQPVLKNCPGVVLLQPVLKNSACMYICRHLQLQFDVISICMPGMYTASCNLGSATDHAYTYTYGNGVSTKIIKLCNIIISYKLTLIIIIYIN